MSLGLWILLWLLEPMEFMLLSLGVLLKFSKLFPILKFILFFSSWENKPLLILKLFWFVGKYMLFVFRTLLMKFSDWTSVFLTGSSFVPDFFLIIFFFPFEVALFCEELRLFVQEFSN